MNRPRDVKEFNFTRQHFDKLRQLANNYSGITVTDEKYEMYYSRLTRRLRKHNLTDFGAYVALVEQDAIEFKEFINCITTNVTSFNREQHHFEYLQKFLETWPKKDINIWSAGCSSGEEPYSIIINAFPICEKRGIKINITATDLDTDVLEKGAKGVYPTRSVEIYDMKTKRQFFQKGTGSNADLCRVKQPFRQMIDFQQLNLMHNWKLNQNYDVIFCRNVLIYFDNPKKTRLARMYWEHLQDEGILFLGHSETLHKISEDFDSVGKTIYRKRG